jgi:site-specific recombinase XerD
MTSSVPTLRPEFVVSRASRSWVCSLGTNWLTTEQSQALWQAADNNRMKEKLDRALLAVLLARGLGPHEAVSLMVVQCGHTAVATTPRITCRREAGQSIDRLVQLSPATEFTSWNL